MLKILCVELGVLGDLAVKNEWLCAFVPLSLCVKNSSVFLGVLGDLAVKMNGFAPLCH
ncbi:MAG: hypothetical protein LCI00_28640 [Chloroflexi bacterium]|nr:hypothetical protein [Chloroflexota bacterium]MCC6891516.1 hypothetical protein [Anaerolineae bacterium]